MRRSCVGNREKGKEMCEQFKLRFRDVGFVAFFFPFFDGRRDRGAGSG